MSRSAYAILGIPENATEAAIDRAYQMRLVEVQTNMKLADAAKQEELLAIEEANRILGRTNSRTLYDRKLALTRGTEGPGNGGNTVAKIFAATIGIVFIAGGYFWIQQREATRLIAEQERIVIDQKAAAFKEAAAADRLKFDEQQLRDAADRRTTEETRLQQARELREREMQAERFIALPQPAPPKSAVQLNRENFQRQLGDMIEISETERQRRQAQQVADRQKRFVEQLAHEEAAAAEARARAVEADNLRRKVEEANNLPK